MTKLNTIAKVCPSDKNYRKSEWWTIYDYLHYSTKVEFSENLHIVSIYDFKRRDMTESREVEIYFPSDRAYKRCKKLYEQWYYSKTPSDKKYGF